MFVAFTTLWCQFNRAVSAWQPVPVYDSDDLIPGGNARPTLRSCSDVVLHPASSHLRTCTRCLICIVGVFALLPPGPSACATAPASTAAAVYVWVGEDRACDTPDSAATEFVRSLLLERSIVAGVVIVVHEGDESEAFWDAFEAGYD